MKGWEGGIELGSFGDMLVPGVRDLLRRSHDSFGVGCPKWVLFLGTLGGQQGPGVPGRSEGLRLGRVDGVIKENECRAHQADKGICGPTQATGP